MFRNLQQYKYVLSRTENYFSLARFFAVYKNPIREICLELFGGSFPRSKCLETPLGIAKVDVFSRHDNSTVNGIFCREDYKIDREWKVFVDIGANIGIATLYFLSKNNNAIVYAFEPVPINCQRFKENIKGALNKRAFLSEVAVSTEDGMTEFTVESSGKFGGIGVPGKEKINVKSVEINAILEEVLNKYGKIDCLKIDTEGLEMTLLENIDDNNFKNIRNIYAENTNARHVIPTIFRLRRYYNVEHYYQGEIEV